MGNGYWTKTAGHFIVIASYNEKTGELLIYDPDSYKRDGWYTWDKFTGLIKVCYTVDIPLIS